MNRRLQKRWTKEQVALHLGLSKQLIIEYEQGDLHYLDFINWVLLASFYGQEVLLLPFTIQPLETRIADEYFMFIRNGESVEYAAKRAVKKLRSEYDTKYTN